MNLLAAGVPEAAIDVTGNTVIDALKLELARQEQSGLAGAVRGELARHLGASWWSRPFVLVTGHRRENFGDGMRDICAALIELSVELPEFSFVYPVHLNPNVSGPVNSLLSGRTNIALIPPQPYRQFVALMRDCRIILTDSGGVQEEGPSLGKPVLVMREVTERPEGLAAGTVKLVGTGVRTIVSGVLELARDPRAYARMASATNPYGDGLASARIARRLEVFLRSRA
jgi:UDP-N-acetylglucosamine 2-epimerase (non-hydrolysing)